MAHCPWCGRKRPLHTVIGIFQLCASCLIKHRLRYPWLHTTTGGK